MNMAGMHSEALLIFIKNPQKGKVKTRLARTVGDEAALGIYFQLLDRTRRLALSLEGPRRMLFYSDQVEQGDGWPESDFQKFRQEGEDLGMRMHLALLLALQTHQSAVLIGSDCPYLSPALLQEAFDQLRRYDLVIGPAADGGYYLIGMNTPTPELFSGINWSTEEVMAQTRLRIQTLGLSHWELPTLSDIDTEADWLSYVRTRE